MSSQQSVRWFCCSCSQQRCSALPQRLASTTRTCLLPVQQALGGHQEQSRLRLEAQELVAEEDSEAELEAELEAATEAVASLEHSVLLV